MEINLCQFDKYSCFGCCGDDFGTKEEVKEGISKNTFEFKEIKSKKKFADRDVFLRECGICRNLILENGMVLCPLHPSLNSGVDHRDALCNRNYLCATFKWFLRADETTQKRFIDFIRKKNPDWYEYSIRMDNGAFLREFLDIKKGDEFIGLGCGALLVNEKNQVLLLRRTGSSQGGQGGFWSQPGGAVEYGETVEQAIVREFKEELGADIELFGPKTYYNDIRNEIPERAHWVNCCSFAKIKSGKIKNMEPKKHGKIQWFDLAKLPENVNEYTLKSIQTFKEYLKNGGKKG